MKRSRLLDPDCRLLDDDWTLTVVVDVQLFGEGVNVYYVPRT